MTQIENARKGIITEEMKIVSKNESINVEQLREDIAKGQTVIIKSTKHNCIPIGIGKDLKVKINSNIGTSNFTADIDKELEKLKISIKYGADTVMDLSTGGKIDEIRKKIINESKVPIGTVPIYQAITQKDVSEITEEDILESIRKHIDDGVDFITIHSGLTLECIPKLKSRTMGVVSRGGSFLVKWMLYHKKENPLYSRFNEIVNMAKKYDVTLSLGDGLRPGCLADATDDAQISELKILGKLAKIAQDNGVQVIIEGPGHIPINDIKRNIQIQKEICNNAPFYVLGPLVTDISPGYDHITGAIGGAIAALNGADFLCYLTPTEHLGLPDVKHVVDGVIASKIAAHAADIGRGRKGARDRDDEMAKARSNLEWEKMYSLALNPEKARSVRMVDCKITDDTCSMCGDYCSAKINKESRSKY